MRSAKFYWVVHIKIIQFRHKTVINLGSVEFPIYFNIINIIYKNMVSPAHRAHQNQTYPFNQKWASLLK